MSRLPERRTPMPSQVTILIAVVAVMFSVIGGLSLLAHYYTLSGIKSKTVGDGQHGTARFATEGEIKKTYTHVPYEPEKWRRGQNLPALQQQPIVPCCFLLDALSLSSFKATQ